MWLENLVDWIHALGLRLRPVGRRPPIGEESFVDKLPAIGRFRRGMTVSFEYLKWGGKTERRTFRVDSVKHFYAPDGSTIAPRQFLEGPLGIVLWQRALRPKKAKK